MSDKMSITNCVTLQINFEARLEKDLEQLPTLANSEQNDFIVTSLIQELESEFSLARDRHSKIITSTSKEAKAYIEDDTFDTIRTSYHRLWARLRNKLSRQGPHEDSTALNSTVQPQCSPYSEVELTKVEIPKFSGAYEDWMPFNNIFTSAVHNNTHMDPIVKLQRLRAVVTGEADAMIRNLEINADNYFVARQLLQNRYQNTRRLVNSYLMKLYDFPLMKTECSKSLKSILNTINDCTSALKRLDLPIEDYRLVYHLCRKLPISLLSAWEELQGASTDLPAFSTFVSFLETKLRKAEMVDQAEVAQKSFYVSTSPDDNNDSDGNEQVEYQKENQQLKTKKKIKLKEMHPKGFLALNVKVNTKFGNVNNSSNYLNSIVLN
uniref:Uncharacterized protein n=1 Tax=Megaselia scalaris TaxID=36166 RepID=T1GD04_MEGSC